MTTDLLGPETIIPPYADFHPRFVLGVDQEIEPVPSLSHLDIMVDIDDVLFPWYSVVHDACRVAGLHNMPDPGTMWRMHEEYGVPIKAWLDVITELTDNGFYLNPPDEDAVAALRRLYWHGARIHLVTARGFMARAEEIRAWTKQWVEDFAVPHHSLTFAKDKVQAGWSVLDSIHRTWDYAIDDGAHNYEALDNAGVPVYLLSQPHNQHVSAARRVATVGEFVDLIIEEHS